MLLMLALVLVVSSSAAEARSCSVPLPIDAEFAASSLVVTGRVVAIATREREWPEADATGARPQLLMRVATVEVERRWKGPTDSTVTIETCAQCTVGARFDVGDHLVVFAGGDWFLTGSCSRTYRKSDPPYLATIQWLDERR